MNLWDWILDTLGSIGGLILLCVAVLALIAVAAYYDAKQWNRYAAAHHCVIVGTKAPSNGFGLDGKAVFIPSQTIYRCDGGEEIIR